ncbi:hypothetical protein DFR67_1235 [Williamsia limnetica]|uniref:Uncharacterized protein n=1 Tax=Williamsia limnetica TaxID=882452 RepID=A0A318RGT2_WILLI|nr:hypothetical protein DFR67_1235 [Williamsia limnetica]
MLTFMVSLDLTAPTVHYEPLHTYLRSHTNWCRPLSHTWVIATTLQHNEIMAGIAALIAEGDKVLIMATSSPTALLHPDAESLTDWITTRLYPRAAVTETDRVHSISHFPLRRIDSHHNPSN